MFTGNLTPPLRMDIKGKKKHDFGKPLVCYLSFVTVWNFNITRDIVSNYEGFYIFPSFQ